MRIEKIEKITILVAYGPSEDETADNKTRFWTNSQRLQKIVEGR